MAGVLHFTLASPHGGDVEEIGNFQERKIRSHGTIFSHGRNFLASLFGGDVEEIDNFQERKTRSHGTFFWQQGKLFMHG